MLAVGEVGRKKRLSDFFSVLISPFALRCFSLDSLVIIDNAGYEQMNIKQCLEIFLHSPPSRAKHQWFKVQDSLLRDKNLRFIFCRADTETFRLFSSVFFFEKRNFPWPSNRHSRSTSGGCLCHPPKKIYKKLFVRWYLFRLVRKGNVRIHGFTDKGSYAHIFRLGAGGLWEGCWWNEKRLLPSSEGQKPFSCLKPDGFVIITRPIF